MKRLATALLLGTSLALTACAASDPSKDIVNYRGGDMKGTIEVARSAVIETPGGLPRAQAVLRNRAGVTQKFEYKFVWFDKNDMSLDEDNRPWHAANVQGRDELTINATAPSDAAKRFQVQIRNPQGVTK